MRRILSKNDNVKAVVYGFIDFHKVRNSGVWYWRRMLANSNSFDLSFPTAKLDTEIGYRVVERSDYPKWVGGDYSHIVYALETFQSKFLYPELEDGGTELTLRLIESMRTESMANKAKFLSPI